MKVAVRVCEWEPKKKRKVRVRVKFYLDLEKFKIGYDNFRNINVKVVMWLNGEVGFYSPTGWGFEPSKPKIFNIKYSDI